VWFGEFIFIAVIWLEVNTESTLIKTFNYKNRAIATAAKCREREIRQVNNEI
jgi:hypothetical protein